MKKVLLMVLVGALALGACGDDEISKDGASNNANATNNANAANATNATNGGQTNNASATNNAANAVNATNGANATNNANNGNGLSFPATLMMVAPEAAPESSYINLCQGFAQDGSEAWYFDANVGNTACGLDAIYAVWQKSSLMTYSLTTFGYFATAQDVIRTDAEIQSTTEGSTIDAQKIDELPTSMPIQVETTRWDFTFEFDGDQLTISEATLK